MDKPNKLFKNTLIYSIGNLGSKFIAFFMVPLYSFFLTKSELGYYDLLLTVISLLVPIITLQISEASYRWLMEAKGDADQQITAVSNSFFVMSISTLGFIVIYAIICQFIPISNSVYLLFILPLSSIFPYLQQLVRGLGDNSSFSISGVINAFTLLSISATLLYIFNLGLEGLLISTIVSFISAIAFLTYKLDIISLVQPRRISKIILLDMIKYAWPLIPNAVSWWMINASNRFLILIFLGVDVNGLFAITNRFPSIILIVNSIFMLAWQDQVIIEANNKDNNHDKIFDFFLRLEFTVSIILISSSRYLVKLIIDPKFYESWKYMPLMYIAVVLSSFCSFLGTGYIKQKRTKSIFYTTMAGGVVNIIVSYSLIERIGLYAPAIGTLTGFLAVWMYRIYDTKSFFYIRINYIILFQLIIITSVYYYLSTIENNIIDIFLITTSIVLAIFINRDLLKYLLKSAESIFTIFTKKKIHNQIILKTND